MTQVTVREKHQITLPMAIVRAARIRANDVLVASYQNGVITLTTAGAEPAKRKSVMDYAGIAKYMYGKDVDEVHAYLARERASWE